METNLCSLNRMNDLQILQAKKNKELNLQERKKDLEENNHQVTLLLNYLIDSYQLLFCV